MEPSLRDLNYGLTLNRVSVVFEANGFSPRAAVDGDALRQLVQYGASEIELRARTDEMAMTRATASAAEYEAFPRH